MSLLNVARWYRYYLYMCKTSLGESVPMCCRSKRLTCWSLPCSQALIKGFISFFKNNTKQRNVTKKRIIFHEKETRADEDKTYKDINMIIP